MTLEENNNKVSDYINEFDQINLSRMKTLPDGEETDRFVIGDLPKTPNKGKIN